MEENWRIGQFLPDNNNYLWAIESALSGAVLKNHNGAYLYCTEAKSSMMASTGIYLNGTNNSDGTITFSYALDAATMYYFSLASEDNDYFVFYANANQTTHLLLIPKGNESTSLIGPSYSSDAMPAKSLRDGMMVIRHNGALYNSMGHRIE